MEMRVPNRPPQVQVVAARLQKYGGSLCGDKCHSEKDVISLAVLIYKRLPNSKNHIAESRNAPAGVSVIGWNFSCLALRPGKECWQPPETSETPEDLAGAHVRWRLPLVAEQGVTASAKHSAPTLCLRRWSSSESWVRPRWPMHDSCKPKPETRVDSPLPVEIHLLPSLSGDSFPVSLKGRCEVRN